MDISSTIVSTTINYLKSFNSLAQKVIVPEFDSQTNPVGINAQVMAVGVNEFTVGEKISYRNYDGTVAFSNKRPYTVKVRIRIYVPFSQGAQKAYQMADMVYSVICNPDFNYRTSGAKFDCAKYDSQTESITLDTFFTVEGELNDSP